MKQLEGASHSGHDHTILRPRFLLDPSACNLLRWRRSARRLEVDSHGRASGRAGHMAAVITLPPRPQPMGTLDAYLPLVLVFCHTTRASVLFSTSRGHNRFKSVVEVHCKCRLRRVGPPTILQHLSRHTMYISHSTWPT
jgi:hypothetical protein